MNLINGNQKSLAKNWKCGMSTSAFGYLDETVFRAYAESNIRVMEISLSEIQTDSLNWKALPVLSESHGVEIRSLHLPFYPFEHNNLASFDANVRKMTIDAHLERIRHMSEAGIRIAVVHPSGEPNSPEGRREQLKICQDSLASLAEAASTYGVSVAVEDLPRTCLGNCSSEILFLTESHPNLCVCFDTNHLLTETNHSFISAVGGRIKTIHVSDYDMADEKHWLPYEGKTDWVELVTDLENAGYDGPFLYEVPMKCPRTLNRRDLVPGDYYANFLACISKKRPSPIQ